MMMLSQSKAQYDRGARGVLVVRCYDVCVVLLSPVVALESCNFS